MTNIRLISFGYGHAPAPEATQVFDARQQFRDPHVSPALREATGRSPEVVAHVLATTGAVSYIDGTALALAALLPTSPVTVVYAAGCVGGRHRSVVIVNELARILRGAGWVVEVAHRDIDKDVIGR